MHKDVMKHIHEIEKIITIVDIQCLGLTQISHTDMTSYISNKHFPQFSGMLNGL